MTDIHRCVKFSEFHDWNRNMNVDGILSFRAPCNPAICNNNFNNRIQIYFPFAFKAVDICMKGGSEKYSVATVWHRKTNWFSDLKTVLFNLTDLLFLL